MILLLLSGCAVYSPKPITHEAVARALQPELTIQAAQINHPTLRPVRLNFEYGITPAQAAILAVLLNPKLRADRDRRGLAKAQLLEAGLLPNPQLSYSPDVVTGGNTLGTVTGYGVTLSWEVTSLLTHPAKVKAGQQNSQSVDLDVAWDEWLTAQAARIAVDRVVALQEELKIAKQIEESAKSDVDLFRQAVAGHSKTELDLATAESTQADAQNSSLATAQELEKQTLELKRVLGLPPTAKLLLGRTGLSNQLVVPSQQLLLNGLTERRLDLLALQKGYQSQEETLRAAVLAQFPKISLGLTRASDTTNVHTIGIGPTIDIPLFDRNQGNIAIERATREKLFDEYTDRVFEARADIAAAIADIHWLNRQIKAIESAIPVAQHLLDVARTAFQSGNVDVLSYEQAKRDHDLKLLQLIKLKEQLVLAGSALEIASGEFLTSLGRGDLE